ncbi:MAG: ECF transporter S component, partial [Erysipelotrichaceae bacterium]|nr:ECF transporter S component [Erysipelotrichaceae bacterium]
MKNDKTKRLVTIAMFTAIVIVLQLIGSVIRFGPFSVSLTLVPIVVGAALFGPWAGAWLGLVFGAVVLISGDAAAFLAVNVLGTLLTVLIKGSSAGLCAGLVYRALEEKNTTLATVLAGLTCPVVNTGLFLLGCVVFFLPTLTSWGVAAGYQNVGLYMLFGLVGANFLFELLVNMILSPVILRLIKYGQN